MHECNPHIVFLTISCRKSWDVTRGHFPVPAGCRNRDFCPPKFVGGGGGATKLFWKFRRPLGFFRRGVFIGEGASSEVDRGDLTHRGCGQGLGRAALVCEALVAPLRLLFGSLEASVKNKTSGTCFVQFREYFLCRFSETQK
jgi:hypothetical protein